MQHLLQSLGDAIPFIVMMIVIMTVLGGSVFLGVLSEMYENRQARLTRVAEARAEEAQAKAKALELQVQLERERRQPKAYTIEDILPEQEYQGYRAEQNISQEM
jgi:hypothetical protein